MRLRLAHRVTECGVVRLNSLVSDDSLTQKTKKPLLEFSGSGFFENDCLTGWRTDQKDHEACLGQYCGHDPEIRIRQFR